MDKIEIQKENPISGKVASILSERELVINIGKQSGAKEGMKFKVLATEPFEVIDPSTSEHLGTIDREKVRIIVSEVKEKFAICQTYRKKIIPGLDFSALASTLSYMQPKREIQETLKIEDSSLPQPLPEEQSYVKIGDRVIQITEAD